MAASYLKGSTFEGLYVLQGGSGDVLGLFRISDFESSTGLERSLRFSPKYSYSESPQAAKLSMTIDSVDLTKVYAAMCI